MKQELLKDKIGTINFTPYINNRPAVSSSATVLLKKPGGELLQASTAATVNSSTGEISYTLSAAQTVDLDENYVAEWAYVVNSVTYYHVMLFDVVRTKLSISVIDDDLLMEQSDLITKSESFSGIVASSSGTSMTDPNLKSYPDDYWNGGKLEVINRDDNTKQTRTVIDFDASAGTIQISSAWQTNPDSNYGYMVKKGFQAKIQVAFEELMSDVRSKGWRPALVLESYELFIPLKKKALHLVCKDFSDAPDDKWADLAKTYKQEYDDALSKVHFQYDIDESGYITGKVEKDQDLGSLRMRR